MKKIFAIALAGMLAGVTVNAQVINAASKKNVSASKAEEKKIRAEKKAERKALRKLEGNEVSDRTKDAFYEDFGQVVGARFERTPYADKVTFDKDGTKTIAYYDADSQLIGTVSVKAITDIPVAAQKYIAKKLPGYEISNVVFYEDNEDNDSDMYIYDSFMDDDDSFFVELTKGGKTLIERVSPDGDVSFFKELK